MNEIKYKLLIVVSSLALLLPGAVYATLIGTEVTCTFAPAACDPAAAIAIDDPTPEFTLFTTLTSGGRLELFSVDLMASEILITSLFSGGITAGISFAFGNLVWSDFPSGIVSDVTLIESNDNLDASNLSFSDHTVSLSHSTLTSYSVGETIRLILETDHPMSVPEPTTFALVGLGIAGLRLRRAKPIV